MIDETLRLLEETVARSRKRMVEVEEALNFAGEAASLFLDVHRLIDDDLQIMEDASHMWAYASSRVRDVLARDNDALIRNEDAIGQAEIILRLNEVVMRDNMEKLERDSEQTRVLHEALVRLEQAVGIVRTTDTPPGDDLPERREEPETS